MQPHFGKYGNIMAFIMKKLWHLLWQGYGIYYGNIMALIMAMLWHLLW